MMLFQNMVRVSGTGFVTPERAEEVSSFWKSKKAGGKILNEYTYAYIYIYIYIHNMFIHTIYIYIYCIWITKRCIYIYISLYVVYVYMYMYVCIYIYIQHAGEIGYPDPETIL